MHDTHAGTEKLSNLCSNEQPLIIQPSDALPSVSCEERGYHIRRDRSAVAVSFDLYNEIFGILRREGKTGCTPLAADIASEPARPAAIDRSRQ